MAESAVDRLVTLVVVDGAGELRGATEPRRVRLPYWQEVGPVAELLPGSIVLRLLGGTSPDGTPMGGHVEYLVQSDASASLGPWPGELDSHPLRMPWAVPGGPGADLKWVETVVDVVGAPTQHRSWNLSALWSIPTPGGTVWLKCVPPFFEREAIVLEHLRGRSVPRLIAADGHRMLLAQMPGEDGWNATEIEQIEMIDTLVDIQGDLVGEASSLVDRGLPDLRGSHLVAELSAFVAVHAADRYPLADLVATLPDRLDAVADTGVPDTLVHGDAYVGNCRRSVDPPIWFDWTDSFVGNPLFDLTAARRMSPVALRYWVRRWARVVPGSDPARAWALLRPVAELRSAWVYQRFLDHIEPSERVYHRADVPAGLAAAEAALFQAPDPTADD